MSESLTWLPNLVDGVPVWQLAADLNQPRLLGGRLLVPDLDGPASMPTTVHWHVADFLSLEDARRLHPADVAEAETELARRARTLELELATKGSPFARFRSAFSLPPSDAPDSWFYDPSERTVRVANWGATRRRGGATSLAVRTIARFAKMGRASAPSRDLAGAMSSGTASREAPARTRTVLFAGFFGIVLLVLLVGFFSRKKADGLPLVKVATSAPASVALPVPAFVPDGDGDGVPDEQDECPELPGTRRGCPEGGSGIVVTRDRITTDEMVFFATGSTKLDPKARAALETIAKLLVENPSIAEILVEGHADAVGDPAKNQALSTDRAIAVRAMLVDHGVDRARVRVEARGARERRVETDAASPENRRVELRITKVVTIAR